jgi:competence protein ComEC
MDYIQQKLDLIDAQRAGRSWGARLTGTAPLFLPAVGLMAGILVQQQLFHQQAGMDFRAFLWIWLALLGLSAASTVLGGTWKRFRVPIYVSASICFLCLGAIRLLAFEAAAPNDIRHLVGEESRLATIRGRILTTPRQQRQDWCFARFAYADPSSSFYLKAEQIMTPGGWHEAAGTVRVRVEEPVPSLRIGDRVQAYCWLHRFEGPTNPGEFDFPAYLRRLGIHVGASVPSRDAVEVQGRDSAGLLTNLRRRFTEAAAHGLLAYAPSDTQTEAMLQALLLGDRRNIDRDTNEAFRRTGLAHLICLSGMHLAILVGAVWGLCKIAGLARRGRALVCIAATAAFLLVVPPAAPTLRAAVVVWVYCLAVLFGRRVNPLNSLSLAAIVLLLLRPTQLFEAGWQLSFSAVAGILAFTTRIEYSLHEWTGDWFRQTDRPMHRATRLLKRLGQYAIRLFSAGTAAWLGGAGILLYHFYAITPLASLWTVPASVPVAAIVTLGFVKILLSGVLPTVSMIVGLVLSLLTDLFLGIVRLAAAFDFSSTLIGHVPLVLILLYYVLILLAGFVHLHRPIVKKGICAALAILLFASLGVIKWQRTHRDDLRLTCLDVGHGQAILAQLPGTMNILFDTGSTSSSDIGARVVTPCLDYLGVGRLHAVVLSHHDIDHINGVPEVVDCRRVDRVCVHDAFLDRSQGVATATLLLQRLEAEQVKVDRLARTIDAGKARIEVVWPAGEPAPQRELSDNDSSLVCLIEFAGSRILLCSDIEQFAQQQILHLHPTLQADVVVAPHHGSTRTLSGEFLPHLGASLLLCSCGRQDWERGRVLRQADGCELFHTARNGAVTVCINCRGVVKAATYKSYEGVQSNE